jgi:hypothetical protein
MSASRRTTQTGDQGDAAVERAGLGEDVFHGRSFRAVTAIKNEIAGEANSGGLRLGRFSLAR